MLSPTQKKIADFVTPLRTKPMVWGEDDCTMMCVRWLTENGVELPGLPSYQSKREAQKLISEAGGLLELWRKWCPQMSLFTPYQGAVGLIMTDDQGPVAMIYFDPYWVCRTESSAIPFVVKNPDENVLASWAV